MDSSPQYTIDKGFAGFKSQHLNLSNIYFPHSFKLSVNLRPHPLPPPNWQDHTTRVLLFFWFYIGYRFRKQVQQQSCHRLHIKDGLSFHVSKVNPMRRALKFHYFLTSNMGCLLKGNQLWRPLYPLLIHPLSITFLKKKCWSLSSVDSNVAWYSFHKLLSQF